MVYGVSWRAGGCALQRYSSKAGCRLRPLRSAPERYLSGTAIQRRYRQYGSQFSVRWAYSQTDVANLDEFFHGLPYHSLSGYDYRGRMYSSTKELRTI